ncbi:MAG: type II toxin-antitoxin system MqsA family antitoxin [Anaerolineae bacterium]|nr:type II toxin-antitoxin system MqsA family antitoxin [Anaerolineae bacterium]
MMSERSYPCEFCDTSQPQQKKLVTVTRQRGGQWFIFENVSAWVCPNCGHRYFDADVLEAMESRMKSTPANARPVTALAISLLEEAG